jgi:hypothetical protein
VSATLEFALNPVRQLVGLVVEGFLCQRQHALTDNASRRTSRSTSTGIAWCHPQIVRMRSRNPSKAGAHPRRH